nr:MULTISPECIES: ATP phosphoribosyltransferase regulatory subunit [Spirulina]
MMIHQPPAGTRDILPLEVSQKRWIVDRLQEVFQRWGYQRIITSTLEWLDTLTAGGAIRPDTVIEVGETAEGRLGLRPELTASIARAAVARMANDTPPLRLYYNANVFRRAPKSHHGRQVEFYQMGVELLYTGGSLADTEIVLLMVDCLAALGLTDWSLLMGEAQLTRSLLAPFPPEHQGTVRNAIAHLDRIRLESLPLSSELQQRALMMFDLRGRPETVLQRVSQLDLDATGQACVAGLKTLIERLRSSAADDLPLILDLSLLETIDYYTGIVFEVVSSRHNRSSVLGKGGRYDQLLALYDPAGKPGAGVGFALNVEDLHTALLAAPQLPQTMPVNDWLVVAKTPAAEAIAFSYAHQLRQSEHVVRVELDLGGRTPAELRDYARESGIRRLAWLDVDGTPEIEVV